MSSERDGSRSTSRQIPGELVKLLELATGLNRTMNADADKLNSWLEAAWEALVKAGIRKRP